MADRDGSNGSDGGSGTGEGFKGKRVTTCSFCGKSSREVGPMVEGPNDVYICSNCTELCQNIFKQDLLPFDLHVLGMPPAFNLSQDQTLQFKALSFI